MKQKILLSILFLSTCFGVFAQKPPIVKVYAYSQAVLQGIKPTNTVDESGKEIKRLSENKLSYFFYVEQKKSTVIKILSVWVKGKNYSVKTDTVLQTPVVMNSSANDIITLVPKSSNKILWVTPGKENMRAKKPGADLKKLINLSELVIVYLWKGKIYYSSVKKIKELKPFAAV